MPYPEKQFSKRLLGQLSRAAQIVIQGCVHHAWVHCINSYWSTFGPQLVLKMVGEQQQGQFTLSICTMCTITFPVRKRQNKEKKFESINIYLNLNILASGEDFFQRTISVSCPRRDSSSTVYVR